jgi:hypothetical protein
MGVYPPSVLVFLASKSRLTKQLYICDNSLLLPDRAQLHGFTWRHTSAKHIAPKVGIQSSGGE